MLEHTTDSPQIQRMTVDSHLTSSPMVPEALPAEVVERIQDYLDMVCAPLVKYLTYAERKEHRQEMESHLESLALAHIELGSDPDEAVTLALQQFGSPKQVTAQWLREWEQSCLSR